MPTACGASLYMYEGEYEGECERPKGHDGPHWDGLTSWRTTEEPGQEPTGWDVDHDTIDADEDRSRFV